MSIMGKTQIDRRNDIASEPHHNISSVFDLLKQRRTFGAAREFLACAFLLFWSKVRNDGHVDVLRRKPCTKNHFEALELRSDMAGEDYGAH